jgi:rhombotail lipoprotein
MKNYIRTISILAVLSSIFLTSCASQQSRSKSSVVDYLYPKAEDIVIEPSIPTLNVPLNVGVAFVPAGRSSSNGMNFWTSSQHESNALSEIRKRELLATIAAHFKQHKIINKIEVIPSAYLKPGGSFTNLDQIKTMYGVDVVALVSYDQTQFTDENFLSFSYWTIVGAYIVSGEKNDTSTLVDTVVYDIKSRKMLFRAPGTSQVKGSATPINLSKKLRLDSDKGFQIAFDEMIINLDKELGTFRQRLKDNPKEAKVVYRKGYGGGSIQFGFLLLLILIGVVKNRKRV